MACPTCSRSGRGCSSTPTSPCTSPASPRASGSASTPRRRSPSAGSGWRHRSCSTATVWWGAAPSRSTFRHGIDTFPAVQVVIAPAERSVVTLSAELQHAHRVRGLIDELLGDPRQLGPDYQPIVRLADGLVVAYKATGRGRPGTELADTLSLLAQAQSLGLVERIDWAFRALAFEDCLAAGDLELHLTPEPETFATLCPPRHAALFARARRDLRVAAEVHADAFADAARLQRGLDEIRGWGWRVVLADLADEAAGATAIASVSPDIVQVDLSSPGRSA